MVRSLIFGGVLTSYEQKHSILGCKGEGLAELAKALTCKSDHRSLISRTTIVKGWCLAGCLGITNYAQWLTSQPHPMVVA